jgi:hypothetical protein
VRCGLVVAAVFALNAPARAIDLAPLWNFSDVPGSEQRFRDALATTTGDDALILQTQIARTYGLRNDFPKAREILHGIEPQLAFAGAEARARHALELGRTYASAAHPAASIETKRRRAPAPPFWPRTTLRRPVSSTASRSTRFT